MKNNNLTPITKEIGITAVLVVILFTLFNPFHVWMADMMVMSLLVVLALAFCVFAAFILKETVADERENSHRMQAGRVAFIAGSAVLTIAIGIQSLSHVVDPWLFIALVVMVIAKITTRSYYDRC